MKRVLLAAEVAVGLLIVFVGGSVKRGQRR